MSGRCTSQNQIYFVVREGARSEEKRGWELRSRIGSEIKRHCCKWILLSQYSLLWSASIWSEWRECEGKSETANKRGIGNKSPGRVHSLTALIDVDFSAALCRALPPGYCCLSSPWLLLSLINITSYCSYADLFLQITQVFSSCPLVDDWMAQWCSGYLCRPHSEKVAGSVLDRWWEICVWSLRALSVLVWISSRVLCSLTTTSSDSKWRDGGWFPAWTALISGVMFFSST